MVYKLFEVINFDRTVFEISETMSYFLTINAANLRGKICRRGGKDFLVVWELEILEPIDIV